MNLLQETLVAITAQFPCMHCLKPCIRSFLFFVASFAKESTSHGIEAGWHDGTAFAHLRIVMILTMIYVFSEFPVIPSMHIETQMSDYCSLP